MVGKRLRDGYRLARGVKRAHEQKRAAIRSVQTHHLRFCEPDKVGDYGADSVGDRPARRVRRPRSYDRYIAGLILTRGDAVGWSGVHVGPEIIEFQKSARERGLQNSPDAGFLLCAV
jgi:hypothetical protein